MSVVAALLLWSNRPPGQISREDLRHARKAAREFSAASSVDAADVAQIIDAIARAQSVPAQRFEIEVGDQERAGLAKTIAEYIRLYSEADLDGYIEWMRSRGWTTVLDRSDSDSFPNMDAAFRERIYAFYTGEIPPSDVSGLEYFRYVFTHQLSYKDGWLRPKRVATGPAIRVVYQTLPASVRLELEPWPGMERWVTDNQMPCIQHWAPPRSADSIQREYGEAITAFAFIPIQNKLGDWMTYVFSAYWSPERAEWDFDMIWISNAIGIPASLLL